MLPHDVAILQLSHIFLLLEFINHHKGPAGLRFDTSLIILALEIPLDLGSVSVLCGVLMRDHFYSSLCAIFESNLFYPLVGLLDIRLSLNPLLVPKISDIRVKLRQRDYYKFLKLHCMMEAQQSKT